MKSRNADYNGSGLFVVLNILFEQNSRSKASDIIALF